MTTHSSILAWKIPWTEEPGRLTMGCKDLDMTEHTQTVSSSAYNDNFTSSLPIWILLSLFLVWLLWLGLLILCWKKVGRVGILIFFHILVGSFSALSIVLVMGLSLIAFYNAEIYTHFGRSFYHKCMLNFIKCFFSIYWDDHVIFIFFCWCDWCNVSHWVICICWTILGTLEWLQLDCGGCFFFNVLSDSVRYFCILIWKEWLLVLVCCKSWLKRWCWTGVAKGTVCVNWCWDLALVRFSQASIFTVRYVVNKTFWFSFFCELLPSNTTAFFGMFIMDNEVCAFRHWYLDPRFSLGNFFPIL